MLETPSWRCIVFTSYLLSQVDYSTSAILARRPTSVVVLNQPPLTAAPISFSAGQAAVVRTTSIVTTTTHVTIVVSSKGSSVTLVPVPAGSANTQLPSVTLPDISLTAAPPTFAVNAGQASVTLGGITSIFTTTTAIPTVIISGVSTIVDLVNTGTSVSLVPVSTNASVESLNSSSKSSMPAHVVALAIILPVAAAICIAILLVKRLRARRLALPEDNDHSNSIAPFKLPFVKSSRHTVATSRTKPISKRQLYISDELQRARQEVAELERLRMSIQSTRTERRPPSSVTEDILQDLPILPTNEVPDSESARMEDKLESAIRQIEALNSRINELELQRRSSWALELSDEPPPGYDYEF